MSLADPQQLPQSFAAMAREDKGPYLIRVTAACITLSGVAIILRMIARLISKQRLFVDDWIILVALPFSWTPGIQMITAAKNYGLGKHVIVVADPHKIEKFWLNLYVAEILYPIATVLIKVSILVFLYRIFHIRRFKIYATIIGTVVLAWGMSSIIPAVFTCTPIDAYWSPQSHPSHTCISTLSYFLGNVIPNLMLDISTMTLPLPYLWHLRIPQPQKIALSGVFLLGGFVTVVGALRLATIAEHQKSQDFTYDFVDLGVWTSLEMNIGIVCACLPSLGPLLRSAMSKGSKASKYGRVPSGPQAATDGSSGSRMDKEVKMMKKWPGTSVDREIEMVISQDEEMGRIASSERPERPIAGPGKELTIQKATEVGAWDDKYFPEREKVEHHSDQGVSGRR